MITINNEQWIMNNGFAISANRILMNSLSIVHSSLFILLLSACANFKDPGSRPTSGVSVAYPSGDTLYLPRENDSLAFYGRVSDNISLFQVQYGFRYYPRYFEEAIQRTSNTLAPEFDTTVTVAGFSAIVQDSVILRANYLPGRIQFYSQARDGEGNLSDSLISYMIGVDFIFPRFVLIEPSLSDRFVAGNAGDSVVVRARPLRATNTPIVSMRARMCQLIAGNRRDTSLAAIEMRLNPAGTEYTSKVEVPPRAQSGSLYRIEVSAIGANGNIQRYLPGIEIR